ncbi:hypothetical protein BDZ94DRAFT_1318492 [Collybia nuda]|uniref:Homeobox domain-containing protein n=1 Tax=Collybia nuda TaxID=64659 RepID=A0A9P5YF16_9AGAR|nr:hypothetical protein BDZ94DRAFT_1318492 [Collybia nuda]
MNLHPRVALDGTLSLTTTTLCSSPSCVQVPDVLRLHRRLIACFVLYCYWMSNSRSNSPTPTPSTFVPINISPSSEPTTSRTQPHENAPSTESSVPRAELSTPRLTGHSPFLRSPSPVTTGPVSRTVRSAESPPDQEPMAKRFRRESPQPRGRMGARSSPSSDSQDDMADTEMDSGRSQPKETLPLAVAPPKKKRTRTLTTPHQAAVLHALLAQSRFPTTAVREEVGRSIGLSARKVQIWFQNQRQKARRPRSQSDTSQRRPPQYGPFPTGANPSGSGVLSLPTDHGVSPGMSQLSHFSGRVFDDRRQDHSGYSGHQSSESFSSSLDSPSHLLGPGMPGSDVQRAELSPRGRAHLSSTSSRPVEVDDPCSFTPLPSTSLAQRPVRSPSPLHLYSLPNSRPTTTSRLHDRDFSRTLPPLIFGGPPGPASFSAPGISNLHPTFPRPATTPSYALQRSSSPETTFAHYPPETRSRSPVILPPPYTLQPAPRWESSSLTPILKPETWSRPGSGSARKSITPPIRVSGNISAPEVEGGRGESSTSQFEAAPRPRSGRYDPVRSTFVHTTPTSEPPSPPKSSGEGDRSGRDDDRAET